MIINILGALANLNSLILWLPQAQTTWQNRKDPQALSGISIGTQILVASGTILWCVYGIMIENSWLPLATFIVLPLALWTIVLKLTLKKPIVNEIEVRAWFTFSLYRQLSSTEKLRCLEAMYTTDFKRSVCKEIVHWESYEEMNELDRMYWDRELWLQKYPGKNKCEAVME